MEHLAAIMILAYMGYKTVAAVYNAFKPYKVYKTKPVPQDQDSMHLRAYGRAMADL